MSKKLMIIGAGGHGRVCADIAQSLGYKVFFLDDSCAESNSVLGKVCDFKKYIKTHEFFVAIGNNSVRQKISKELLENGAVIATLISPQAYVAKDVKVGAGTVVVAGAVVNSGAKLGDGVIINTCSSVDHDCEISDFVHVSVGSHIAGSVFIGQRTMTGAGSTVINNISVCRDVILGAGAVAVKNIEKRGTYIGVPATLIKEI